jgi:hypothetical protein
VTWMRSRNESPKASMLQHRIREGRGVQVHQGRAASDSVGSGRDEPVAATNPMQSVRPSGERPSSGECI